MATLVEGVTTRSVVSPWNLDSLAFAVTVVGGVVTLSGPVVREPVAQSLMDAVPAGGRRCSRPGPAQLSATVDGSVHSA